MGVLVVGMHRSGTSALAGALEAMGLFVGPSDALIGPHPTNPEGHFELRAVADLNDEVLAHFGGAWDWPPTLPDRWMADPAVERLLVRGRELVRSTFAGRQFLLKDPRFCLLLPFWRRVLSDQGCAVVISRDPAEVAWSLARRDEMPNLTSLALWSAYNRSALEGLVGMPVHVCRYAHLLERPVGVLDDIAASLREFGELPPGADVAAGAARIKNELRTAVGTREQRELICPPDVVALDTILMAGVGRHDRFHPPSLPEPSRWEQPLLEERRDARSQWRAIAVKLTRTERVLTETRLETTRQVQSAENDRKASESRLLDAEREFERRATEHHIAMTQRTSERDAALLELAQAAATENQLRQQLAIVEGTLAYFDARQQRRERRLMIRLYRALQRRTRLRLGEKEGARIRPYFDAAWYLENYPDVESERLDPLRHYVRFGEREGRRPNAYFSPEGYLESYPDVAISGLGPLEHYARFGRREGRRPGSDISDDGMGTSGDGSNGARARRAARSDGQPDREIPWFVRRRSEGPGSKELPTATRSILVLDVSVPLTDQDSGSYRMFHILSLLRHLGHGVIFGADAVRGTEQHIEAVRELGIEVLVGSDAIEEFLRGTSQGINTVWVARPEVAARYIPMVKAFSPTSAVIYDTVDLHWRRFELQAIFDSSVTPEMIRRWRLLENTIVSWADHVIAITEEDAALIRSDNRDASVSLIPNVHGSAPFNVGYEARRDLVFLGGFHHAPNVDAVEHFVERILPLVLKELPDVRFFIVGSNLEEYIDIEVSDSIVPVGFVPELEPCLAQFRIMVVPLRYGAGMKGKVGSSLVNGLPVVTTPVGAEGIELVDGVTALIAEDDQSFARAVVTLYRDSTLWDKISTQGRAHAEALYSPAVVEAQLDGVLRQIP